MSAVYTAIGVGAAVSGGISYLAADKASDAQQDAAEKAGDTSLSAAKLASETQLQMFEQTRSDLAPWRKSGAGALNELNRRLGVTPAASALTQGTPGTSAAPQQVSDFYKVEPWERQLSTYGDEKRALQLQLDAINAGTQTVDPEHKARIESWLSQLNAMSPNDLSRDMSESHGVSAPNASGADFYALEPWEGGLKTYGDELRALQMQLDSINAGEQTVPAEHKARIESFINQLQAMAPGDLERQMSPSDYETSPGYEGPPGYEPVPEFTESPGYQFTLQQGLNAQQNALSAMGQNRSGKHIKAATEYAEGLASTEYDNFLRRWYTDQAAKSDAYYNALTPYQSLAGVGLTAGTATGQLGGQAASGAAGSMLAGAQGAAQAQLYGGQAQAGGYINQANALTGALTGGANQLLYINALRNLPQPEAGGFSSHYIQPNSGYTPSF